MPVLHATAHGVTRPTPNITNRATIEQAATSLMGSAKECIWCGANTKSFLLNKLKQGLSFLQRKNRQLF
ncbi:hypothetical protein PsAD37_02668 [Pseudovibrio sp. Ad37]|nr:hypothetical protein PsAD37_02668 [Pseudovibrio sp. Ad37]